jgi:hypothetical protein
MDPQEQHDVFSQVSSSTAEKSSAQAEVASAESVETSSVASPAVGAHCELPPKKRQREQEAQEMPALKRGARKKDQGKRTLQEMADADTDEAEDSDEEVKKVRWGRTVVDRYVEETPADWLPYPRNVNRLVLEHSQVLDMV